MIFDVAAHTSAYNVSERYLSEVTYENSSFSFAGIYFPYTQKDLRNKKREEKEINILSD